MVPGNGYTPGFGGGGGAPAPTPAPTPTPPPYVAQAVHFDGATWLYNSALSSGDNYFMSFSVWVKTATDWSSTVVYANNDSMFNVGGSNYLVGDSDIGSGKPNVWEWQNWTPIPIDANGFSYGSDTSGPVSDSGWHHLLGTTDGGQNPKITKLFVDGTDVSAAWDTSPDGDLIVPAFNGLSLYIGTERSGGINFVGDMADLWIAPGQSLLDDSGDIPTSTLRKFISADGKPVDLGSDCTNPTGIAPAVCFSGDASSFATNRGTGGAFTLTGTLTDASTSPSN